MCFISCLYPQCVVTNKEHVAIERETDPVSRPNASQVPRPNISQVPRRNMSRVPRPDASQVPRPNTPQESGPKTHQDREATMSHTQVQLKRMRERWRSKVTSASRISFPRAAELPEQLEEKVWPLFCHAPSLRIFFFSITACAGRRKLKPRW